MDNIEQKAKELIDKFVPYTWSGASFIGIEEVEMTRDNPKECAIICVDEILKVLDEISIAESGTTMMDYGQSEFKKVRDKIRSL